jgi:hypothetical protein
MSILTEKGDLIMGIAIPSKRQVDVLSLPFWWIYADTI